MTNRNEDRTTDKAEPRQTKKKKADESLALPKQRKSRSNQTTYRGGKTGTEDKQPSQPRYESSFARSNHKKTHTRKTKTHEKNVYARKQHVSCIDNRPVRQGLTQPAQAFSTEAITLRRHRTPPIPSPPNRVSSACLWLCFQSSLASFIIYLSLLCLTSARPGVLCSLLRFFSSRKRACFSRRRPC